MRPGPMRTCVIPMQNNEMQLYVFGSGVVTKPAPPTKGQPKLECSNDSLQTRIAKSVATVFKIATDVNSFKTNCRYGHHSIHRISPADNMHTTSNCGTCMEKDVRNQTCKCTTFFNECDLVCGFNGFRPKGL